jgi:hypothetical protein
LSALVDLDAVTSFMMITALLVVATLGGSSPVQSPPRVTCSVLAPSILSRSSSGVVQVSNLALMSFECRRSPPRPMPPSQVQYPFKVEAVVYQVSETGQRILVPSTVTASGTQGDTESEAVLFYLDIPVDDAERDAAVRAFIAALTRQAAASPNEAERAQAARLAGVDPRGMALMMRQHRVGRFRVEFRILDQGRLDSVAGADLEVAFKGSFFDQMLPPK